MGRLKNIKELMDIESFIDRLDYLYIGDKVGNETFGHARWLNQRFYRSAKWKKTRNNIILRDNGCDLAMPGYELSSSNILVHHIMPITIEDIMEDSYKLYDPNNLICVSLETHNKIHYGTRANMLPRFADRTPYDTCPWRK